MPIHVTVFDDHMQRRYSLQFLLNSTEGFACNGLFEDGVDAVSRVKKTNADVVLMDIDMPVVNGIEATKAIRTELPGVAILMQAVIEDDDKIFKSIKAGANGCLLKHVRSFELLDAIKNVHEGRYIISPGIARKMLTYFSNHAAVTSSDHSGLTPQEKEIMSHFSEGESFKMISTDLKIDIDTINDNIRSVYRKLYKQNV